MLLLLLPLLTRAQPGSSLFDPSYVHEIRFNAPYEALFDTLEAHYEFIAFQGTYVPITVTVDGVPMDSVGVKQKGITSNYMPGIDGHVKKPFKVHFSKYVEDRRYDGQRKLNLHNGFYDPSHMHEALVYRVLRDQGMPASRTAYARVYLNDVYWGLYLLVEDVDKPFLDRHFDEHGGNLYKRQASNHQTCFNWDPAEPDVHFSIFEQTLRNSGDESFADIAALLATIHTPTTDFAATMAPVMDMDGLLTLMAAGYLFQNEDDVVTKCNNFFLYHANDGRFHWLPWDFNATFSATARPLVQPDLGHRPLIEKTLADPALRTAFLDRVCAMAGLLTPEHLFPLVDSTYALIRPHLAEDPHRLYPIASLDSVMDFDTQFWVINNYYTSRGIRPFIADEWAAASEALLAEGYTCLNTTGVAQRAAEGTLLLVPNPAQDHVRIVGGNWANTPYTITDHQERQVAQGRLSGTDEVVPIGGLAPGVYHLQLHDAMHQRVLRLVTL